MRRAISVTVFCTACRDSSGRPKVSRSRTQSSVRSRQRCAWEYPWAASAARSPTKPIAICAKPSFSAPTRFSTGTRQSVNVSSAVSEARQPSLSSGAEMWNPGVSVGMTSRLTPAAPLSSSPPVRTAVTTKSARVAEVM